MLTRAAATKDDLSLSYQEEGTTAFSWPFHVSLETPGQSQPESKGSIFEEDFGMGSVGRVREVREMEKRSEKRDE